MRDVLRQEMNKFIAEVIVAEGEPVVPPERAQYGSQDFDAYRHIKGFRNSDGSNVSPCSWALPENPVLKEEYSIEYIDTDCNDAKTVIKLFHVSCICGQFQDRILQYEGTLAEFIPKLFFGLDYGAPKYD